jgi:RimJ/RimL family protein N-acetyltransferase
MRPVDSETFRGFDEELRVATGYDYVQVVLRRDLAQDGPGVLYVATAPDGGPIYAQWLVRPRDREALYRHSPGRYSELGDEDVLVEGAYTFLAFRRRGAMADGMAQLLQIAADEGMHTAYTYVEVHNIPSLRGCAEVGFTPHHMRASVRRLGLRRGSELPVTDEDREVWDAATR